MNTRSLSINNGAPKATDRPNSASPSVSPSLGFLMPIRRSRSRASRESHSNDGASWKKGGRGRKARLLSFSTMFQEYVSP